MSKAQRNPTPIRSAAAQRAALVEAEAQCKARGQAWTAPRRKTYELLLAAGAPRTAYDLIAGLKRGAHYVGPPTVYRALDFLVAMGLAHRVETRKAYVACAIPVDPHAAAFLICEACGRADEQPLDLDTLRPDAGGFALRSAIVEIRGTCAACSP